MLSEEEVATIRYATTPMVAVATYVAQHRYRTVLGDDTTPWTGWCDLSVGSEATRGAHAAQRSVDAGAAQFPLSEYRVVERTERVVAVRWSHMQDGVQTFCRRVMAETTMIDDANPTCSECQAFKPHGWRWSPSR